MKTIKVSGLEVIIDESNYDYFITLNWRVVGKGYIACHNGEGGSIYMHRMVMNYDGLHEVHHKNGNKLDNRKENLEILTHGQNRRHNKRYTTNRSGHNGISFQQAKNKWVAFYRHPGKTVYISSHDKKEDAVLARENYIKGIK